MTLRTDAPLTEREKLEQRRQLAVFWSEDPESFRGCRFGDLLRKAEDRGTIVYWGCWTDDALDEVL